MLICLMALVCVEYLDRAVVRRSGQPLQSATHSSARANLVDGRHRTSRILSGAQLCIGWGCARRGRGAGCAAQVPALNSIERFPGSLGRQGSRAELDIDGCDPTSWPSGCRGNSRRCPPLAPMDTHRSQAIATIRRTVRGPESQIGYSDSSDVPVPPTEALTESATFLYRQWSRDLRHWARHFPF